MDMGFYALFRWGKKKGRKVGMWNTGCQKNVVWENGEIK